MSKTDNDNQFETSKEDSKEYEVCFASPIKRFIAFIIDFFINTLIITLILYLTLGGLVKDSINSFSSNEITIDNNKLEKIKSNKKDDFIEINNKNKEFFDIKKTPRKPSEQEQRKIIVEVLKKNRPILYVIFVIPILYNIVFLKTKRQATPGQQFLNLCVIKKDNKKLNIINIIDRVLIFSLSKMPVIVPFSIIIPILITKEKTTIYDIFSGTRVIEIKQQ